MRIETTLILTTLLTSIASQMSAVAQEPSPPTGQALHSLPAVDGLNVKLSAAEALDDIQARGLGGSLTLPIGHALGLQIDAATAEVETDSFGDVGVHGVGLHFFWRDPARGMIGFYGHAIHADIADGVDIREAAAEAALYLDRFTLGGLAGLVSGDVNSQFSGNLKIDYYPTDDIMITVGHGYGLGQHQFRYGAEWAFTSQGGVAPSLFLDGMADGDGEAVVLAGARVYWGQSDKPLIRRHREDDPYNPVNISIYYNLFEPIAKSAYYNILNQLQD
ncbi:MAG: hypothetical protein AAGB04_06585 [Pseudomonadota bacterium]